MHADAAENGTAYKHQMQARCGEWGAQQHALIQNPSQQTLAMPMDQHRSVHAGACKPEISRGRTRGSRKRISRLQYHQRCMQKPARAPQQRPRQQCVQTSNTTTACCLRENFSTHHRHHPPPQQHPALAARLPAAARARQWVTLQLAARRQAAVAAHAQQDAPRRARPGP